MTVTDLPVDIKYGKVTGRFLLAVPDSTDAGSNPDAQSATGHVKFVPRSPNQRATTPNLVTVINRPVVCELDADGYLVDSQGNLEVWLVTGIYDVTFSIKDARIAPLAINVTEEYTAVAPLDLALAIPPYGPPFGEGQYAELSYRIGSFEDGSGGGHYATAEQGAKADTAAQPADLATKVGKGELVVNALDYGVVGNNVVDDSTAMEAAVAAAVALKRTLWVPPGLTGVRLTRTLTARGIDVALDSNVVIAHTSGPGIVLGGTSSASSNRRVLSWASVANSSVNPVSPSVRLIGMKQALVQPGTTDFLQLYADGGVTADNSIAYCTFQPSGGLITTLELMGVNGVGWINDNHWFGGRFKTVRIAGSYGHNGNVWYGCTVETGAVDIQVGSCNRFYSARFEGSSTATFSASAWNNYLENSYTSNQGGTWAPAPLVVSSDLGSENVVVSQAGVSQHPVELLRIDRFTNAYNATCEVRFGTGGNIIPGHRLVKCRAANLDVFDTGILPIEQRAAAASGVELESFARMVRINMMSSHVIWRPRLYLYDVNMNMLDPTVPGRVLVIGGLLAHANGFYYYGAPKSDCRFLILDTTAKYARLAASTSLAAGTPFDFVTVTGFVQQGQVDSIAQAWRRGLARPLYQTAAPTEGLAQTGETIGSATGRHTCISRVDTTLTADAVAAATTLTVAAITGISSGDVLGVLLADGTTHWTTVSGAPTGTTVTLAAAVPAAGAVSGANVGTNRWVSIT